MSRPPRPVRAALRLPGLLYRMRLGRLLGTRFLLLTHRGRRTGRLRLTVLEVLLHDARARESIVLAAWGARSDWYRNLEAGGGLRVQTAGLDYVPEHVVLSPAQARSVAAAFGRLHPLEVRLVPRALRWTGSTGPGLQADPVELLASRPMVALRPRSGPSRSGASAPTAAP